MGTKRNPGQFDCYAAALDDEPMFILLGRDPLAPLLVGLWAAIREADEEAAGKTFNALLRQSLRYDEAPEGEKAAEAYDCAAAMESWRAHNDGAWRESTAEWIDWLGCSDAPVDDGVLVDVKMRDGRTYSHEPAGCWRWHHVGLPLDNRSDIVRWRRSGDAHDRSPAPEGAGLPRRGDDVACPSPETEGAEAAAGTIVIEERADG